MKRLILISVFLLIILFNEVLAQSFNLYSIDTSNFPNMKALFYARTPMGVDYPNITTSDFDFYENGVNLNPTLGIDCKKVDFYPQLAVVLVLDVSTSMNDPVEGGEKKIDWVKQGAFAFLDSIKLDPPSVIAYVLFAGDVYKTSPLYDTKQPLYDWLNINLTYAAGSTDFYPPFVKAWPPLGALPLLETTPKDLRRVVIFLSDGQPERPFQDWKRDTIINYAKRIKAQVYSLFIKSSINYSIDLICQATGGKSFEINTKQQIINAFRQIVGDIQSRNVCYLTWVSPFGCDEQSRTRNIKAIFKRIPDSVLTNYFAPEKSLAKLDLSDTFLLFGAPGIGTTKRQLTMTAVNTDFTINSFNINSTNKFTIDWKGKTPPFNLLKNQSHTIEINYIESPAGASSETGFQINAVPCPPPIIRLIAPCGGEVVSKIDFGKVQIQTVKNQNENCVFKNTTAVPLTFNLSIEGVNSSEFLVLPGLGPFTLNPGECLNITVQFRPQSIGSKSARIKFNIPNHCGEFFTNVTGEGIPSALPIQAIDFGVRRILTINDTIVTIKNVTQAQIEIQKVELASINDQNFYINPPSGLPLMIAPGESFDLAVRFNPQTEGYLENQVLLSIKDFSEPAEVQIIGIGGLPKITAPDVDCGRTKVGNTVTADLIIMNPSQTMDLYVREIILPSSSEFKFSSGAKTTDIVISKNNGQFAVPIDFTPSSVGTRKILALIKSDAAPGPSKNPIVNDTILIFGVGTGLIVYPDPIDFGEVSTCATKDLSVVIDNSPYDSDLQILGLNLTGPNSNNFQVVNFPTVIKPKESGVVTLRFLPEPATQNYSANLEIFTNYENKIIPIIGKTFTETVSVDYKSDDSKLVVSKDLILTFEVNILRDHSIEIGNVVFDVKSYKKSFILKRFESKLLGWNWDINPTNDGYQVAGKGTPFPTPASFQNTLTFETFLSDVSNPDITIKPIFPGAENCLMPKENKKTINLVTCFTEGRLVEISDKTYCLFEIQPSPVESSFDINIEIAFDDFVNLTIFNSMGLKVLELVNAELKAGKYSFHVDSKEINSGVYFVKMNTRAFTYTRSFVIVK